jgi:hypothetical protein
MFSYSKEQMKNRKKQIKQLLLSILIFMATALTTFGQGLKHQEPCGTMEIDSINRAKYPGRGRLEDFEDFIQQRISEIKKQKKGGRVMADLRFIPIIVHVVHNGEAVGVGANISQAQVQSQIEVLNEDFRKMFGTPGGASPLLTRLATQWPSRELIVSMVGAAIGLTIKLNLI